MKPTPWIVFDTQACSLDCAGCNERQAVPMPIDVRILVAMMEAFVALHDFCGPVGER